MKSFRYSKLENSQVYFLSKFEYMNDEKVRFLKYFPINDREIVYKKIHECVSVLYSRLLSNVQHRSMRKAEIDLRVKIYEDVVRLTKSLDLLSSNCNVERQVKLYLYECSKLTLSDIKDHLEGLEATCLILKKQPILRGIKDPFYFQTVKSLANIWKDHTGKKPTLHYDNLASKTCGPFLKFLELTLLKPFKRKNKEIRIRNKKLNKGKNFTDVGTNEIFVEVSLSHMAKRVIHSLKYGVKTKKLT